MTAARGILAAATLAALLSGCAIFTGPPRQPTPPPATGPRPTADGRDPIVAAYQRFWTVASTVDARPHAQWRPALAAVATEPVLSSILTALDTNTATHERQYGTVVTHPIVARRTERQASIVDCQDASRYGVVDLDTGLPTMIGNARTAYATRLERGTDGIWRVAEVKNLPDTC